MAEMLTIQFRNPGALTEALSRIDGNIRGAAAKKAVTAGGYQVMNHARMNIHSTFSRHQTGQLSNSIRVDAEQQGAGAVAHVRPYRVYARIQEFGGAITPKTPGGRLVWRDPDTGTFRSAAAVTLPPRPYLRPALADHVDDVEAAMIAVLHAAMR